MNIDNLQSFRQAPRFVDAKQNGDTRTDYRAAGGEFYVVPPYHWLVMDTGISGGVSIMSPDAFTALYEPDVTYAREDFVQGTANRIYTVLNHLETEARARAENCTALAQQTRQLDMRVTTLEASMGEVPSLATLQQWCTRLASLETTVGALAHHAVDPSATSAFEMKAATAPQPTVNAVERELQLLDSLRELFRMVLADWQVEFHVVSQ
jgi:hypothetical protein